jgi:hypothetical protein
VKPPASVAEFLKRALVCILGFLLCFSFPVLFPFKRIMGAADSKLAFRKNVFRLYEDKVVSHYMFGVFYADKGLVEYCSNRK